MYAWAEGYQVNTLSARQNGMGHTGTALHLGAESQIFNPAGLGWLDKDLELSGSFTAIFATASATLPDGRKYKTDNTASTPIGASLGFSIYDNLKAGVAFYTPYGSSINWTDNWPGATLNQSVDLKVYTIQPTVAWRPVKNLSVGAGVMLAWGNVDLNKGLVSPQSMDALITMLNMPIPPFGDKVPASVNLNGTARLTAGINIGVMYDINPRWTVGFNYRQKMTMKVRSGEASLRYANQIAEQLLEKELGVLNSSQFKASMPCPAVFNFGVSYRPVPSVTLAFDAQLTGWKTYRTLDIEFLDSQLTPFDQHITKDYHDSWAFRLGAQCSATDRLDLRAGLIVDTAPVDRHCYNPETPAMTKIEPSVGLSFRPLPNLSVDASLLYVAGLGADGRSVDYVDLLAAKVPGADPRRTFTADYSVYSFCPSIGFTLSF